MLISVVNLKIQGSNLHEALKNNYMSNIFLYFVIQFVIRFVIRRKCSRPYKYKRFSRLVSRSNDARKRTERNVQS
jgi:ACR3 family arsenite efflux pump ArsB